MNRKLKVCGGAIIAALAMSALATSIAPANPDIHSGGHFTHTGPNGHAEIKGTETNGEPHTTRFFIVGQTIKCTNVTYQGTAAAATVTELTLTPAFPQCWVEPEAHTNAPNATVFLNGCDYVFYVRNTDASLKHSPLWFKCPVGKKIEIVLHGSCTITIATQTITEAVTYTTITSAAGVHEVTPNFTALFTYEKHGLCEFLSPFGTGPHAGALLAGSATLRAFDKVGSQVHLTATGLNGK